MSEQAPADIRRSGATLFAVGFLVLFLELASIRWFAANVVFLQYFTNVVLLASFLGMSCGCMAAVSAKDWLGRFPLLGLTATVVAIATLAAYLRWTGLVIDVGSQTSPQMVFFGTEYRNPDVARFVVPIEAIAAMFFVLIALMFVGPGQALGRAFDAFPDRIMGYTLNIGGSLAGIAGFSLLSWLQTPPVVWFAVACVAIAWLLWRQDGLTLARGVALVALIGVVSIPINKTATSESHWSPYYSVSFDPPTGAVNVNTIGHQYIVPYASGGASYSLIHLLQKNSGGPPFADELIIGAGTGNDIDHALHYGVRRVDAVEIDPVIQHIGFTRNPDRPYHDPRVVSHLDDGRHFMRTTDRKYDLVVYALVDSLILHSSYANLRLESYLFTPEAFADARRLLKPGGTFVMYNYYREGWIVQRISAMAEKTFGCPPLVFSLPYQPQLAAESHAGFTMIVAGCNTPIRAAFRQHQSFWLNNSPAANFPVDGFTLQPQDLPPDQRSHFYRIAPTRLIDSGGPIVQASDDWPFLYLRGRLIPDFTLRSIALLGVLGIGMVWFFLPKGRLGGGPAGRLALDNRMFFLGAAFMLLETRAVVQTALLFGSTWIVNSAVFFTVLVLILLANLFVLKVKRVNLAACYAGLFAVLALAAFVPADTFLSGGVLWRYAAPCVLALAPMLFAGVIFARSFRDAPSPDLAFAANIAGSVVGGLAESASMLLGFQHLLWLAMAFYLASMWVRRPSLVAAPQPA
jgi:SAM-dependent methyltransferase